MGVCASLSASIVCKDKLWGMLVLHHYMPRHVSADLRVACEAFAQMFSLQIEAKSQAEDSVLRIEARRIREEMVSRFTGVSDIGQVLTAAELLLYVGASGAAVYVDGRLSVIGETPATADIIALVDWLNGLNRPMFATEQLSVEYPPATHYAMIASGLLAVGVSREPHDYILWFRPDVARTVRWAGDPSKPVKVDRHGARLTPRGSFAVWREEKKMQSAPWSEVDLEAAEALRVVLLESILKSVDMAQRERAFAETRAMAEELERRVVKRTEQLHALASELEAVEDRERRQIARDLHDDLGQTLAAARIRLAGLCSDKRTDVRKLANEVDTLIDRANMSTRSLAAQLAPAVLYELGLVPALDSLGDEIRRIFGLKVTVIDDGLPKPLSQEARSILYRAVRELLINVAKHAHTDTASVESERDGERIIVQISDGGAGFDPAAAPGRGLGLFSVRERLFLIGGTTEVNSTPGKGTVVLLSAPLATAASVPANGDL
jgi:two-component system, chemotaxis family, sensor kinase Cph1